MLKGLLLIMTLALAQEANAGDYWLYIYNSSSSECKYHRPAKFIDESCDKQSAWQSCAVSDVNRDTEKYLNNNSELKIFALAASVTNGHISFCSREAKLLFHKNLLSLNTKVQNQRHLNEFIKMYQSK